MTHLGRRRVLGGLLATCGTSVWPASRTDRPSLAITMDDLDVNADDTPRLGLDERNAAILAALRSGRLKAAMFVCGMRVDNDAGRRHLRQWGSAGHLLANHTYSHRSYHGLSFETFSADVLRGEAVIAHEPAFRKRFRFPMLKEGDTREKRDAMRRFLKARGYRPGHVTIDASDWAIDARLRKRLALDPAADVQPYRNFYLEHLRDRSDFYDSLSHRMFGRSIRHTLLIHHNLLNALFLGDVLRMFVQRGWTLVDATRAFEDPIFEREPDVAPAGESLVWALAKESGRYDGELRYPGEDSVYEDPRMDALGL